MTSLTPASIAALTVTMAFVQACSTSAIITSADVALSPVTLPAEALLSARLSLEKRTNQSLEALQITEVVSQIALKENMTAVELRAMIAEESQKFRETEWPTVGDLPSISGLSGSLPKIDFSKLSEVDIKQKIADLNLGSKFDRFKNADKDILMLVVKSKIIEDLKKFGIDLLNDSKRYLEEKRDLLANSVSSGATNLDRALRAWGCDNDVDGQTTEMDIDQLNAFYYSTPRTKVWDATRWPLQLAKDINNARKGYPVNQNDLCDVEGVKTKVNFQFRLAMKHQSCDASSLVLTNEPLRPEDTQIMTQIIANNWPTFEALNGDLLVSGLTEIIKELPNEALCVLGDLSDDLAEQIADAQAKLKGEARREVDGVTGGAQQQLDAVKGQIPTKDVLEGQFETLIPSEEDAKRLFGEQTKRLNIPGLN